MRMRLLRHWEQYRPGDTLEADERMVRWLVLHHLAEPVEPPKVRRRGPRRTEIRSEPKTLFE